MNRPSYWYYSNSEKRVVVSDRKPSKANSVREDVEDTGKFQEYNHTFTDRNGNQRKMATRCGFDRGPKRLNLIKDMLGMKGDLK